MSRRSGATLHGLSLVALLALSAAPVKAGELAAFADACGASGAGPLPPAHVLTALMTTAETPWSPAVIAAYSNTLTPSGDGPKLADMQDAATLRDRTANVIGLGPSTPEAGISARVAQGQSMALAMAYLGGDFRVLTILCPAPSGEEAGGESGGEVKAEPRLIRIGGGVEDLTANSLGDQGFATLGYVNDREADSEVVNARIVLGAGSFEGPRSLWTPYVSYERSTDADEELNDLAFGLNGLWRTMTGHQIGLTASYETDDDFDSRMYRAELNWELPGWQECRNQMTERQYLTCRVGFKADYAEVGDAGDKAALLTVNEYTRAGTWVRIVYGHVLANEAWAQATLDYDLMESLDGDEGDASIIRIGLNYLPAKTSRFRVGISYENGEDITSLTRSETVKIDLGFRY